MDAEITHVLPSTDSTTPSVALAGWLCAAVAAVFAAFSPACWHWFIVPVTLCGVLVGADAIDWLRGRLDVFDPAGLLGLFGLHFFFAAPLIHVSQDFWIDTWSTVVDLPPSDWRPWVGGMALLNLAGLLVYRRLSRVSHSELEAASCRPAWRLETSRFVFVFPALLLLGVLVQIVVVQRFGGLSGYTAAYESEGFRAFEGWGRTFLISEATPLLAFMTFAVLARGSAVMTTKTALSAALLLFVVLCIGFGGLRGSRGYTVWNLFWAVGIVHFCCVPFQGGRSRLASCSSRRSCTAMGSTNGAAGKRSAPCSMPKPARRGERVRTRGFSPHVLFDLGAAMSRLTCSISCREEATSMPTTDLPRRCSVVCSRVRLAGAASYQGQGGHGDPVRDRVLCSRSRGLALVFMG